MIFLIIKFSIQSKFIKGKLKYIVLIIRSYLAFFWLVRYFCKKKLYLFICIRNWLYNFIFQIVYINIIINKSLI